mmetsp:Transcript_148947/g.415043  ORF Transcript_148947/g.415043 Transcript_148947/m.415043 type:complete len:83 (-) Transcript_148947:944-1192(-)
MHRLPAAASTEPRTSGSVSALLAADGTMEGRGRGTEAAALLPRLLLRTDASEAMGEAGWLGPLTGELLPLTPPRSKRDGDKL